MKTRMIAGMFGLAMACVPFTAHAQDNSWLLDLQNPVCSDASKQTIADAVRKQIEESVARATAAIKPPAALGDLSCLNDLMTAPLDSFSQLGGVLGTLQAGYNQTIATAQAGVTRQVCQFAAEKWGTVTDPLNERIGDITGAAGNIWDNFDYNNLTSPRNNSSNSSAWLPTNSDGSNTLPGVGDDYGDTTVPEDDSEIVEPDPPEISGCSPAMVALRLCTIPPRELHDNGR